MKIKLNDKNTAALINALAEAKSAERMANYFGALVQKEARNRNQGESKLSDAILDGFKKAKADAESEQQRHQNKALEAFKMQKLTELARDAGAINPSVVALAASGRLKAELNSDGEITLEAINPATGHTVPNSQGNPMTAGQLLQNMKDDSESAYLFGGGQAQDKETVNPWRKETLNLTQQGKILTDNPALAARLKAEAGK